MSHVLEPVVRPLRLPGQRASGSVYRVLARADHEVPYALYRDQRRITLATRPEAVAHALAAQINRQAIESSIDDHVLLHAAAATRAGITVILPAEQERGKTTTVAGLLREGYGYVTDEAVALDPSSGRIEPFPKALSIDRGAWPLFPECRPQSVATGTRQWNVPADRLGAVTERGSVGPPRVVVFPMYAPGNSTRCTLMSRGEGVRELAQATFHFPRHATRNLRTLAAVAAAATIAQLRIGSLEDAVEAIEMLVSQQIVEELCG
ncbi:MAG: hypothetical protein GEU96_00445 [Propionibacteriales bacterium]|nr:hypothetical protein [Propionibacteriales bacterium]